MTYINVPSVTSELLVAERDILTRVAEGGPLIEVLRDIILMVEKPSNGEMLASILIVSDDGKALLEGAAPSLPADYNAAIHGISIGHGVGSCGTAAFSGEPVIVTDISTDPLWADFRDLALGYDLHACWSMPIKAADGRVLGTFANYYREPKEPTERDLEVIGMVTRTTAIAMERYLHEQARERSEQQRLILLRELNHRVKNVFTVTQSLLRMSLRSAKDLPSYAAAVEARLAALSRAHELVQPDLTADAPKDPSSVSFGQILYEILAPYVGGEMSKRVNLKGPRTTLVSPNAVTGVSLILHELATNAAKYGALSGDVGQLDVSWTDDGVLNVRWDETAADIKAPTKLGFGSTLTRRTVEGQFGGQISYDWRPDGLKVEIAIPLSAV